MGSMSPEGCGRQAPPDNRAVLPSDTDLEDVAEPAYVTVRSTQRVCATFYLRSLTANSGHRAHMMESILTTMIKVGRREGGRRDAQQLLKVGQTPPWRRTPRASRGHCGHCPPNGKRWCRYSRHSSLSYRAEWGWRGIQSWSCAPVWVLPAAYARPKTCPPYPI